MHLVYQLGTNHFSRSSRSSRIWNNSNGKWLQKSFKPQLTTLRSMEKEASCNMLPSKIEVSHKRTKDQEDPSPCSVGCLRGVQFVFSTDYQITSIKRNATWLANFLKDQTSYQMSLYLGEYCLSSPPSALHSELFFILSLSVKNDLFTGFFHAWFFSWNKSQSFSI